MSATELRQAAETLRGRASKAVEGPWCIEQNWIDLGVPDNSQTLRNAGDHRIVGDVYLHYGDVDNGAYIATMHPGVGLALADWLEHEAERSRFKGPRHFLTELRGGADALAVARLINGGAA